MTELVEPVAADRANSSPGSTTEANGDAAPGPGDSTDREAVAARLRERGERVRRRQLDTAFRKLESEGDLTPEQRRVVERLSARLADAMVERWVANLADADPEVAVGLFEE